MPSSEAIASAQMPCGSADGGRAGAGCPGPSGRASSAGRPRSGGGGGHHLGAAGDHQVFHAHGDQRPPRRFTVLMPEPQKRSMVTPLALVRSRRRARPSGRGRRPACRAGRNWCRPDDVVDFGGVEVVAPASAPSAPWRRAAAGDQRARLADLGRDALRGPAGVDDQASVMGGSFLRAEPPQLARSADRWAGGHSLGGPPSRQPSACRRAHMRLPLRGGVRGGGANWMPAVARGRYRQARRRHSHPPTPPGKELCTRRNKGELVC